MAWPYPSGVVPRPDNIDHELRADPDEIVSEVPECRHCHSTNLRPNGSYFSKLWDERRYAVICNDCHKSCYLPLGQHLPRKPTRAQEEKFIVADDDRPACPFCSGRDIQRKGLIHLTSGGTSQRWFCRPCGRRFVSAAHRVASGSVDHRKVQHWELADPKEEALFLFHYSQRNGNIAHVREDIGISDHEKNDLDFLVADGVLPRAEVDEAIWFRALVLEAFDDLVHKQRQCLESLAGAGMLAESNAAPMAQFRDRAMEKVNSLIDAELAAMAEPAPEKKEPTNNSDSQYQTGDELVTKDDR